MKTKITHAIFDFDGTLVSTVSMVIKVLDDLVKTKGARLNKDLEEHIESGRIDNYEIFCKKINHQLGIDLDVNNFKHELFNRCLASTHLIKLQPGVEKLVKHLHAHGIAMAVASGNMKKNNDTVMEMFGHFFPMHFSHVVSGMDDGEVVNNKPHPDIFHVCARRFKSPPVSMSNVVIFEDSLSGIQSAINSGAHTVLINSSIDDSDILSRVSLRLTSLEDFKPEVLGLPSFDD